MNGIVMIMKPDSSSFEVRAGLCLPSAIPSVRLQCKRENGGGTTGCHPTAQSLLAQGRQVSLEICSITANHQFFPGQRPHAVRYFKGNR